MLQIDAERLYSELDRRRRHEGISWSTVAREIGSSPPALSRLRSGTVPCAAAFARALVWLDRADVREFVREVEERTAS